VSSGEGAATPVRVPCLSGLKDDALLVHLKEGRFVWVDLVDPSDDDFDQLAKLIDLHPLTLQNARRFNQHPKLEAYAGYAAMVVFGVDPDLASGEPMLREVNMIVSGEYVVTIHRGPLASLDEVRDDYHDQPVRSEQFLVYKILDAVTSTFGPVLSRIDDDIDDLEQQIIDNASVEQLQRIFSLKRDLVAMRRVVSPMRDLFARDSERLSDLPGLQTDDRFYYRDLYDSLIRTSELVDSYRDLLSGTTDMYLSTVANRQGEINKQLTIIATIFLPLTFLTGFFGQNFAYMIRTFLSSEWQFWVFGVGVLVVSAIGVWLYLRTKRWV
jgi:magnesium transporter